MYGKRKRRRGNSSSGIYGKLNAKSAPLLAPGAARHISAQQHDLRPRRGYLLPAGDPPAPHPGCRASCPGPIAACTPAPLAARHISAEGELEAMVGEWSSLFPQLDPSAEASADEKEEGVEMWREGVSE